MTNKNCKPNQNKCCNYSEQVEKRKGKSKSKSIIKIQSLQRGKLAKETVLKQRKNVKYKLKDYRKELISCKGKHYFKLPENKCSIFESRTEKVELKGKGANGIAYKLCLPNNFSDKNSKTYAVKIVPILIVCGLKMIFIKNRNIIVKTDLKTMNFML